MPVSLKAVALPDFVAPLGEQPDIPAATYEARANNAYRRAGVDWLVVYADREHFGNMIFLSGFEPRFGGVSAARRKRSALAHHRQ
jgi:hypothetical protein